MGKEYAEEGAVYVHYVRVRARTCVHIASIVGIRDV